MVKKTVLYVMVALLVVLTTAGYFLYKNSHNIVIRYTGYVLKDEQSIDEAVGYLRMFGCKDVIKDDLGVVGCVYSITNDPYENEQAIRYSAESSFTADDLYITESKIWAMREIRPFLSSKRFEEEVLEDVRFIKEAADGKEGTTHIISRSYSWVPISYDPKTGEKG